jgi:hypothetical protein
MTGVGINQDHQIISKPRILDAGVLAASSALLGSLQHPIYLIEITWFSELCQSKLAIAKEHHEGIWQVSKSDAAIHRQSMTVPSWPTIQGLIFAA